MASEYRFEIVLHEDDTASAIVWQDRKIVSAVFNTELDYAEDWIQRRAKFLGRTEYSVDKTLRS